MAAPFLNVCLDAAVMITADFPGTGSGSGFLVSKLDASDPKFGRVFLVTNKHVLAENKAGRDTSDNLIIHCNLRQGTGQIYPQTVTFPLKDKNGSPIWQEHPDPHVDVLVIDITRVLSQLPHAHRWVKVEDLVSSSRVQELDVTAGESIYALGFPLEMRQGDINHPIVRGGITATHPGQGLWMDVGKPEAPNYVKLPIFLVDIGIVQGQRILTPIV